MFQVVQHHLDFTSNFSLWIAGAEHPRCRAAQQPGALQKEHQEQPDDLRRILPVVPLRLVAFSVGVLRLGPFLPERTQHHFSW